MYAQKKNIYIYNIIDWKYDYQRNIHVPLYNILNMTISHKYIYLLLYINIFLYIYETS